MFNEEIMKKLKEAFTVKEIEWKIQTTSKANGKDRGMAVAYIDSRAIQKRLDETVGAFNWQNEYGMWQEKSQICGLSIYCEERKEWIIKFDGAENTDYEPIKGGLSDSFKRAAILWGIGRYLYDIDGVWVDIEPRGKSWSIKQDQYKNLEAAYNQAVARIFGSANAPKNNNQNLPKKESAQPSAQQSPVQQKQPDVIVPYDYKVNSIKPSGKSSSILELTSKDGEIVSAYVKSSDSSINVGVRLKNVDMVEKSGNYGPYNLINSYELAA